MTSLKEWNAEDIADMEFEDFKVFIRGQYRDLQEVGGLLVQNLSLNLIKELKEDQEQVSNTLKVEVRNRIIETMQALNFSS